MAKPRPKGGARNASTAEEQSVGLEEAFRRIANLLALALVKGESETGKVLALTAAGYSLGEIAQLLDKRPNTVSAILYQAKREKKAGS